MLDFSHPNCFPCPQCKVEKELSETPLLSLFLQFNGIDRDALNESRYYQKRFIHHLVGQSQTIHLNPQEGLYHTRLWACLDCLKQRKALLANIKGQNYGMGGPIQMYLDISYDCQQCQQAFVFSKSEQQYWYEDLG
ncbi:MAG: zinc-ribbon domain containing protein, partial [Bacteroidota bacterium]